MALADDATDFGGDERDLADLGAPLDRPVETLAAADLPPPQPLRLTLERLTELDDDVVLLQHNDRKPQHLYPKLDDRGYEYGTKEVDDGILTAVWRP